jgi:type II secretory pathway component PulK
LPLDSSYEHPNFSPALLQQSRSRKVGLRHLSFTSNGHGDATALVCLSALAEAQQNLNRARRRYSEAALALTISREKLEPVVELAFQQQRFGPIEALFREEEAALNVYENAVAELAQAEERYFILRAALANERTLMLMGPVPRQRMH